MTYNPADKLNKIADLLRDIAKLEFLNSGSDIFDAVIIITETNGHKYKAAVRTTLNDEKFDKVCEDAVKNRMKLEVDK